MRQTDGSLVIRDRFIARVAAPFPNRARTVARANQARILQGRASIHRSCSWNGKENYVGIDVAKAGMDIAVRPTDERWSISNDEAGIRQLVSRLKTLEPDIVVLEASGGLELPLVASPGGRGVAGSRSQPTPGARLCQGHWKAGQD